MAWPPWVVASLRRKPSASFLFCFQSRFKSHQFGVYGTGGQGQKQRLQSSWMEGSTSRRMGPGEGREGGLQAELSRPSHGPSYKPLRL